MSPDFSYFVFQTTAFRFSHTLLGIPFFCVPTSLAVLWLFHSFLKYPLLSLLPEAHHKRLFAVAQGFRFGPLPHFAVLVFSITVGALTHLGWDAFTHEGEWGTRYLAFLRQPVWQSGTSDPLKFCDVLQHASTILGLVYLVFWCRHWLRQKPATAPDSTTRLPVHLSAKGRKQMFWTFVITALVLAIAFNYNTKLLLYSYASFQAFLRLTVLLGVPILLAQLCLYSVIWHLIASRQFSYEGESYSDETSATREPRRELKRSSGEYSMRFSGDEQAPAAETQHLSNEQRPSVEYSMRSPH
jgi:hypothetical protein